MTLGRRGLAARPTRSPFTRDRQDGGGGGTAEGSNGPADDAGDVTDDTDDDDSVDEDGDDDSDDEELKPAGTRALKAERDKVKDLRRQLRELREAKAKPDTGKEIEGDTPEAKAAREAADTERARELAKPLLVKTEARRLLTEAGLIGKPDGLLRMLDLKAVDIDYTDDGDVDEIDGLSDQIDGLREDYPTLFRKRGGGSRIDATDKGDNSPPKKKSASEIQAAGLRGGR